MKNGLLSKLPNRITNSINEKAIYTKSFYRLFKNFWRVDQKMPIKKL